ncbi:hypothetical protein NOVO_08400 [Rickettsiales bacterium Ac37b]|nr:hypothetical protein NOVO_08400 [Rickettsiales bacterium Ac37b]
MIITHFLTAPELLTTFKVIKVHYEPFAESVWTLQFEDYEPIDYFDKCFRTKEEDMKLVGRTIRAQIDLQVDYEDTHLITNPEEQVKSLIYVETGSVIATGIYFENAQEVEHKYNDTSIDSCIDSLFKLHLITTDLSKEPFNFEKGSWVRVKTSESNILIDRKYLLVD